MNSTSTPFDDPRESAGQKHLRKGSGLIPAFVIAAVLFTATVLEALQVQSLNLAALTARAHRVFRGTVLDIRLGSVEAGGGLIPTVTYRIKVTEPIAGLSGGTIDLTMVSEPKQQPVAGTATRFAVLGDLPKLKVGQEYLLFTTPPSRIGLSAPVGLGQGLFELYSREKKLLAVNGANNAGLGLPKPGPVEYTELVAKIRALKNR